LRVSGTSNADVTQQMLEHRLVVQSAMEEPTRF